MGIRWNSPVDARSPRPGGRVEKAGLAVTLAPHHLTLSTQEAADLLRILSTTLVRLLESGVIPFDKPSRHRKVRLADLLESASASAGWLTRRWRTWWPTLSASASTTKTPRPSATR